MDLVNIYTKALAELLSPTETLAEGERVIDNFIALTTDKGHIRVISKVLQNIQDLESMTDKATATLTVAAEKDIISAKEAISAYNGEVTTKIDPTLIGGYMYDNGNMVIDTSYKRYLLNLYREIIA